MRRVGYPANGLCLIPCGASTTWVKRCDPPHSLTVLFKREMSSIGKGSLSGQRSLHSPHFSSRPMKTTTLSGTLGYRAVIFLKRSIASIIAERLAAVTT